MPAFSYSSQRGNALFIILIAVALFAALSYAVTRSGRGGGGIQKEQDVIIAARIVQTTATLRTAVMRLQMSGVAVKDILFHATGDISSPCTETDGTCLFTPEGGGATYPQIGREIPAEAYDPALLGNWPNIWFQAVADGNGASGLQVVGAGSNAPDATFTVNGLRKSVCEAINKGLGIEGIPAPSGASLSANLPDYYTIDDNGRTEGCIDTSDLHGMEAYQYYALLAAN